MLRPPGPKPHFLIGNIPLAGADSLTTYRQWAAEYGDIFYYRAAWLHVYFLNRPDFIEQVLIRSPQNFLKDRVVRNSLLAPRHRLAHRRRRGLEATAAFDSASILARPHHQLRAVHDRFG